LNECSSFSGSLHLAVDVVDLFPSHNHQVWVEIWLRDRDSHNWFYLLLTTWIAQSLNWMRTPVLRFYKQSRVTRLFKVSWTRVLISRRSKTDHYAHHTHKYANVYHCSHYDRKDHLAKLCFDRLKFSNTNVWVQNTNIQRPKKIWVSKSTPIVFYISVGSLKMWESFGALVVDITEAWWTNSWMHHYQEV